MVTMELSTVTERDTVTELDSEGTGHDNNRTGHVCQPAEHGAGKEGQCADTMTPRNGDNGDSRRPGVSGAHDMPDVPDGHWPQPLVSH